jgi:hypothetical protein
LIFSCVYANNKAAYEGIYLKGDLMKNSLKGPLLSGLVYPGSGQVMLKRYGRGITLICIVTCALVVFFLIALQRAFTIMDKLRLEGGIIDMNTISKAAAQASTASDNLIMTFCLLLILICWLIGMVDAYLTGKKMDVEKDKNQLREVV